MKRIQAAVALLAVASTALCSVYYMKVYRTRDLTPPEIISDTSQITDTIRYTEESLKQGLHATDERDGDVSDTLVVESVKIVDDDLFNVTYAACDRSYNVSKFNRLAKLEDYHEPRFTISEPLRFPLGTDNTKIIECLGAEDCIDGDLSSKVKIKESDEDRSIEGIYNLDITVTNSLGDTASLPVSVEFYTDSYEKRTYYPQIKLTDYLVYLEKGSEFSPKRYLDHLELGNRYYMFSSTGGTKEIGNTAKDAAFKSVAPDGQSIAGVIHLSAIRMNTNLNTEVSGTYNVTFSCTTADNYFGSVQMTVIVV